MWKFRLLLSVGLSIYLFHLTRSRIHSDTICDSNARYNCFGRHKIYDWVDIKGVEGNAVGCTHVAEGKKPPDKAHFYIRMRYFYDKNKQRLSEYLTQKNVFWATKKWFSIFLMEWQWHITSARAVRNLMVGQTDTIHLGNEHCNNVIRS